MVLGLVHVLSGLQGQHSLQSLLSSDRNKHEASCNTPCFLLSDFSCGKKSLAGQVYISEHLLQDYSCSALGGAPIEMYSLKFEVDIAKVGSWIPQMNSAVLKPFPGVFGHQGYIE